MTASQKQLAEQTQAALRAEKELRELMAQNRADPQAERELRIRDLRLTGGYHVTVPQPEAAANEVALTYSQQMPTCKVEDANADIVRAALKDKGCLYMPQALTADEVTTLRDALEQTHQAAGEENADPAWYSPPSLNSRELMMGLYTAREWSHSAGGCLAVDSPRAMFQICDVYERLGLRELAQSYLGEAPVFSHTKFMLWRVPGNGQPAGWHQDGRFLGDVVDINSLNFWVALTDCGAGEDAPGMELVLKDLDYYIMADDDCAMDWLVSDKQVDELFRPSTPVVIPTFKAGDVLAFDHWLLHRSSRLPEQTGTRYAIESWMFAPSAFPAGRKTVIV